MLLAFALAAVLLSACGNAGSPWPGIASDTDKAYIAFEQSVRALHLSNGQEAWHFPVEKPARDQMFYAAPALSDSGLVIAGSYDHKVYALRADRGDLVWTFAQAHDRILGSPVVSGDVVFVPVADGTLYALNVEDGVEQWSFQADGALWSAPLVVDDHIYLGTLTHKVQALDREGNLLWTQDVGGAIAESPSLVDSTLVVGAFGRPLIALDPATGEQRWSAPSSGWAWAGAISADGKAYFGDLGGRLAAVSLTDGSVVDETTLEGPVTVRPAVDSSFLFVATETGLVRAFQLGDFTSEWTQQLQNAKPYGTLILQNDLLIFGVVSREFDVVALDAASGQVRWTYPSTNP
jgi:outer membrane protein assembly factor BamB